jgi:oligopeptide/dipeptide ABC transporter ATP-binding protein
VSELLTAVDLRVAFARHTAVDGVTLAVRAGEMLALVGESGSGKTTTAHAMLGLLPRQAKTSAATLAFEGRPIAAMGARELRRLRRELQLIFQDPYESLDPRLRVIGAVEEPLVIHGLARSRTERRRIAEAALEQVGLVPAEVADRYPHELSGGQRQRVAIAAALILRPKVLVADEPVSMLDATFRSGVLRLLAELRDAGLGLLMITHDLSSAAEHADRIAVMYLGRVVEEGPAREVVSRPSHPYTQALLSAVPRADPRDATTALAGDVMLTTTAPEGCRFHPRCPFATPDCRRVDPALVEAEWDHSTACLRFPELRGDADRVSLRAER